MTQSSSPQLAGSQWLIACLLAASLVAFIAFLSLAQITASGAGSRLLALTVAETTGLDSALPGIKSTLGDTLEQSTQDPLTIPNFPIPVLITRDEAIGVTSEDLYSRILNVSGTALYNGGVAAWDDADPDASQAIARGSTAGAVRLGIGFVGSTQHTIFLVLAVIAGVATLLFAFYLFRLRRRSLLSFAGRLFLLLEREFTLVIFRVVGNHQRIVLTQIVSEDRLCHRILYVLLDRPAQGTGSEFRVVSLFH